MENEPTISPKTVKYIKGSLELCRGRAHFYRDSIEEWLDEQKNVKDLLDTSLNIAEDAPASYKMGVLIICDFLKHQPELLHVQLNEGERFVNRLQQNSPEFLEFVTDCEAGKCFVSSVIGRNERHQLINGIWDAIDVLC